MPGTSFFRTYRYLIIIVALNVVLGSIGLPWGLSQRLFFHPDEQQHVDIAKNFIHQFDPVMVDDSQLTDQWNGRGFAVQNAVLSYPLIKLFNTDITLLFVMGRILSLFYASLLVVLVYQIAKSLFTSNSIALLSSLWFSLFDLKTTNSHFATPDVMHVFYLYLSLYFIGKLVNYLKSEAFKTQHFLPLGLLLPISLGVAMCGAVRFDVVPAVLLFGVMVFSFFTAHSFELKRSLILNFFVLGMLIAGFFGMATGFNYGISDGMHSLSVLRNENLTVVKDAHPLTNNPLLYFFAILGGTGLFATLIALFSSVKLLIKRPFETEARPLALLLLLGVALQFLLLWFGTATFVRHGLKFLPLMSVVVGWGTYSFLQSLKQNQRLLGIFAVSIAYLYTFFFTAVSQLNFVFDTRYQATPYLRNLISMTPGTIGYSNYSTFSGFPPGEPLSSADIAVIHETLYGRYSKYFTTPFIIPQCCDQVYHCQIDECRTIQTILYQPDQYTLLQQYQTLRVFPEKELFYSLFGTYETFLGDVRVYQKNTASPIE